MKLKPLPCLHAGVIADCEPDHAPGDIGLTAIIASLTQTAKMQCGELFYPRVSLYQSAIITPCGDSSCLLTAFHILVNQEISNRTLRGLPRNQFFTWRRIVENSLRKQFENSFRRSVNREAGLQNFCMLIILVRFGDAGEWPCQNNSRMRSECVSAIAHMQWTPRITWWWLLLLQNVITTTTRTTRVWRRRLGVYSSLARVCHQ
jgi:hypothetical protein